MSAGERRALFVAQAYPELVKLCRYHGTAVMLGDATYCAAYDAIVLAAWQMGASELPPRSVAVLEERIADCLLAHIDAAEEIWRKECLLRHQRELPHA